MGSEMCIRDRFYHFVGKTPDGFISTRRRNVRTKSWSYPSQYSSSAEFEKLLEVTISHSIKKDILNHMKFLNEKDRIEVLENLSRK